MKQSEELLTRRVEKVLPSREGLEKLLESRKIRLYQGFDPTGTKLHLGHSIGLRKLMEFAYAGQNLSRKSFAADHPIRRRRLDNWQERGF